MQTLVIRFNANQPQGLKIMTWIMLHRIPSVFFKVVLQITSGLGLLLGSDT